MPKSSRIFLCTAFLWIVTSVFAQTPTNSLNGKTIHLYVESDDFTAFYFQNGDLPLANPKPYLHTITLSGIPANQQDFYFTSNGTRPAGEHFYWKLGTPGLSQSSESPFTADVFQGKDTLWIILDPSGPISAPPILTFTAPKTIHVLNPWTETIPVLLWGENKTRKMTTTPGRCGWFTAMILDPLMTSGYFADIGRKETFGKTGLGSNLPFDFASLFTTYGHSIWLNTKAQAWTAAWPNQDGVCQYKLAATVRDFSKNHPDFDFGSITGDYLMLGMVQNQISAARKPLRTTMSSRPPVTYTHFDDWWTTDTSSTTAANMRRSESCFEMPMSINRDGIWEYDSYRSGVSHGFWPANGALNYHGETSPSCYVKPPPDSTSWVTNGAAVNANFCMESHATFIYQPGQTFDFRGDDDVWVFINDKLVIDLGGVHTPKSASIHLDLLNLVAGQEYRWDFFYCDRQPCGSALTMKTSIAFKQKQSLFGKTIPGPTPGTSSLEIWKRVTEQGYCASIGDGDADSIKATDLTYHLLDELETVIDTLGIGIHHGGITISNSVITIDTSKLVSPLLNPGASYSVAAFEENRPDIKAELPFRMSGTPVNLHPRKIPTAKQRKPSARNALGRKIPVTTTPRFEIIKDRTK